MNEYNADATSGAAAGMGAGMSLLILAVSIFLIVCLWKIFTKAGHPGWASIIPIYNLYILTKIIGKPGWWVILFLVPFVNIIMAIILPFLVAKVFGQSAAFGVGLLFLPIIFYPILAFGSARYLGPAAV